MEEMKIDGDEKLGNMGLNRIQLESVISFFIEMVGFEVTSQGRESRLRKDIVVSFFSNGP